MKKPIISLIICFVTINFTLAQEKYAVLICGAPVIITEGDEHSTCYNTHTDDSYHWTEFWAEIYNTWELLIRPVDEGGNHP
jgi:hypothetical protein